MSVTTRFIYFDLGNVLLTFDHRTACRQLGALCQLPQDKVWKELFDSKLQDRYEQGEITSRQVYEMFCERAVGARDSWPDYEAFHLANSDIFDLNVPVIAIVAHLRSAGHRLGILSNTCEEHWKHVSGGRFMVLQQLFERTVLSYEQRASKPESRIYEIAVELAGVEPGEIFFMDDRPENVQGANRAGLDAVQYRSPQQLAADLRSRGLRFNY